MTELGRRGWVVCAASWALCCDSIGMGHCDTVELTTQLDKSAQRLIMGVCCCAMLLLSIVHDEVLVPGRAVSAQLYLSLQAGGPSHVGQDARHCCSRVTRCDAKDKVGEATERLSDCDRVAHGASGTPASGAWS